MAKTARPRAGGKLALFEVLQTTGNDPGGGGGVEPSTTVNSAHSMPVHASPPGYTGNRQRAAGLFQLGLDPAQGRVGVSASYLGAFLTAAGIVAVITLGFVAGRFTAGSDAAGELARAKPMPEVMDVGDEASRLSMPPPSARLNPSETTIPAAQAALPPAGPVKRVAGMNYVLVESYAKSERNRAEATVDALRQAGIGATIEENVPGWSSRLCVFGTEPFERVKNNPQYTNYTRKIDAVSSAESSNKLIKRLNPTAVLWGR